MSGHFKINFTISMGNGIAWFKYVQQYPLDNRRLISSMFDISPLTRSPATAVVGQQVGVIVNRLVGMGFKT